MNTRLENGWRRKLDASSRPCSSEIQCIIPSGGRMRSKQLQVRLSQSPHSQSPAPQSPPLHSSPRQHRARTSGAVYSPTLRSKYPPLDWTQELTTWAASEIEYDAIVIGGGVGGLTAAAQMVAKGANVLVLEKYLIPGGSASHFKREGYTFDVGSSMMFGFGDEGTTNLLSKALSAVGKSVDTIPDPTQVAYHLPPSTRFPQGMHVQVGRDREEFLQQLISLFPHETKGIRAFYQECWDIFQCLNTLELKSLEEPLYLMTQLFHHPVACLKLASYLGTNTGDVAQKYIKDPQLLGLIDSECFVFSTVKASHTPMINAGMVLSDRFYGHINYPKGGVGRIPFALAEGVVEKGGRIVYKAHVKNIITEQDASGQMRAVGVKLADGRTFRGKSLISNATRWDTFEAMLGQDKLPESEKLLRNRFKRAPSFFSMHMGVDASIFPKEKPLDCHHIILDDWVKLEDARGLLFVSMPSIIDPSVAPEGHHVVHAFTSDWIDSWQGLSKDEYEEKKEQLADEICERIEKALLPGLRGAIKLREIGTPKTHRRYLGRDQGTYGPIPSKRPWGIVGMPLNRTSVQGLYCVGDSTFPGQGVNAVAMSGIGCAHRVMVDLGMLPALPRVVDDAFFATMQFFRDRA